MIVTRRIWLTVLLMGLPALIGGGYLHYHDSPDARLGLAIDRSQAIALAAAYAQNIGYPVIDWPAYVRFQKDNDLYFYQQYQKKTQGGPIWPPPATASAAQIGVRFHSSDRDQVVEVRLDTEGHPVGFQQIVSRFHPVAEASPDTETKGERAAQQALANRLASLPENYRIALPASLPSSEVVRGEPGTRIYRWTWPIPEHPELNLVSVLKVREGRVVGDWIEARVEKDFVLKILGRGTAPEKIALGVYYLILSLVIIFGVFRFIERVRQKEVSYSRSFLLAGIVAIAMSIPLWLSDLATYDSVSRPDLPSSAWLILAASSFFFILLGLLLGLAYASGEGDLREPYPGKLASLDVLLTGRPFSQNVARGVLIGAALGGWFFLGNAAVLRILRGDLPGSGIGEVDSWFGVMPWLNSLTFWLPEVILIAVIGILIPLPFLHRRFRAHRRLLPLLIVIVWIACLAPEQFKHPLPVVLLLGGLRMAVTILAFLKFDLLTAIVALGVPLYAGETLSLLAQPAAGLHEAGLVSALLGLLILAVMIVASFHGLSYREEDVRPLYAVNVAERLAMQAEMDAARQIQIQLLPDSLPALPGLSIGAVCLPAREAGGDYYDVNVLGENRISILVAEGGGNGLGSALSIAFARGYLLPLVTGRESPLDLVREVTERLLEAFGTESRLGFLLAVIDEPAGLLQYARSGDSPRLRINAGEKEDGTQWRKPEETVSSFASAACAGEDFRLAAGVVRIEPGQTILINTEGVEPYLYGNHSTEAVLSLLSQTAGGGGRETAWPRFIRRLSGQRQRIAPVNDLTAVVVKIEER